MRKFRQPPKLLTYDDVTRIHETLVADFEADNDPIRPPGIKSTNLLQSAVFRQSTGSGGVLKYSTAVENAAALAYGICSNHPFHNGNKRTSLVALLCHLDKNDWTFKESIPRGDLYDFMLKVAAHGFAEKGVAGDQSDREVRSMAKWIRERVRLVERGERQITFRELRTILSTHGFYLEAPADMFVHVVRYEMKAMLFGLRTKKEAVRIMRIAWPSDGAVVGKQLIRELRERCGLTEQNGVDSHCFYAKDRPIDYFVQTYRGTLKKLARV